MNFSRSPHRIFREIRSLSARHLSRRAALRRDAESKALESAARQPCEHLHLPGCPGGFPPGSLLWNANFDLTTQALPGAGAFGLRGIHFEERILSGQSGSVRAQRI